ncbi:YqaJ viral recombinase family protein [Burkholderia stabilis]|uniref:YqaJ viral recombinase family nuclease n=1 Tax=Burkholderia stabilis TaxID=95485 RepID=UPI000A8B3196|nr:YqaJ viral recombinase family protein [Burkholderia stabilis]
MNTPHPEPPRSRKPALKLVKTADLSRDGWLAVRRTGIGGSDAAAAVGLNPYMSALELWLDKTGRAEGMPRPDPADTTSPTYWGTLLEPIVAAAYTAATGNRVRKVNAVLRHSSIPWMLANIDREIVGVRDVQILECKTAGEYGARLWRDGPPEYVLLQVQHQLAVTGKTAAHVAVLICGQALEVHRIERDDALIGRLSDRHPDQNFAELVPRPRHHLDMQLMWRQKPLRPPIGSERRSRVLRSVNTPRSRPRQTRARPANRRASMWIHVDPIGLHSGYTSMPTEDGECENIS